MLEKGLEMTPAELISAFLTWLRHNRGRSERTVEIYRLALELLVQFLAGRDLREATDDDLVLFTGLWLHKRGVMARGRRPYIAAVRGFYRWMAANRHAQGNPAAAIAYADAGRPLPRVMTLNTLEKLIWAPDLTTFHGVRDVAVLSVFAGCGLRVGGVVSLNVSDLIQQDVAGRRRLFIRTLEKGNKERLVPVPLEADMHLRVYLEHPELKEIDRTLPDGDQVLFVSTRNRRCPPHLYSGERRRLTTRGIYKMVETYGRRLGLPGEQLHPHALRHLFGTELAEDDVDFDVRQRLLGHADPKSTRIYTHLAVRKLIKDVDRANPLAKVRTPVSELLERMQSAAQPAPDSSKAKKPTPTR